jgi:hypothetical protein
MPKQKKIKHNKKRKKTSLLFRILQSQQQQLLIALVLISCLLLATIIFIPPKIPDDRPERINAYFEKYNMPLLGHGQAFVDAADTCGMDWRLLPAIAVRESSGGKHMQLNNPFGWGSAKIPFESIDDAIAGVGMNLCGFNTNTAKWYSTTSTYKKLYYYNGTVMPTYPDEVIWIMDQF